jgi:hypothetical protein
MPRIHTRGESAALPSSVMIRRHRPAIHASRGRDRAGSARDTAVAAAHHATRQRASMRSTVW